jgi:single-strand DNA-binding protein
MSYQRIIIQGNLGGEPEIVTTKSGKEVVKFRLAQSDPFTQSTNWFSCEYWRGGKVVGYLAKGGQILVEGSMRQEEWEKDGVKRTSWIVNVDNITLLGGGGGRRQNDDDDLANDYRR